MYVTNTGNKIMKNYCN